MEWEWSESDWMNFWILFLCLCDLWDFSGAPFSFCFFPTLLHSFCPSFFPYSNDNCWGRSIILIFAKHQSFFPFLFSFIHSPPFVFVHWCCLCVWHQQQHQLSIKINRNFHRETGYRVGSVCGVCCFRRFSSLSVEIFSSSLIDIDTIKTSNVSTVSMRLLLCCCVLLKFISFEASVSVTEPSHFVCLLSHMTLCCVRPLRYVDASSMFIPPSPFLPFLFVIMIMLIIVRVLSRYWLHKVLNHNEFVIRKIIIIPRLWISNGEKIMWLKFLKAIERRVSWQ